MIGAPMGGSPINNPAADVTTTATTTAVPVPTGDPILDEIDQLQYCISSALSHPIVPAEPMLKTQSRQARVERLNHVSPAVRLWTVVLMDMYDGFDDAATFREPVNAFSFNPPLLDYHASITDPVSIRGVIDSACSGGYSNTEQMKADLDKIWVNAELFNGPTHVITKKAHRCREYFASAALAAEDREPASTEEVERIITELTVHSADDKVTRVMEFVEKTAPHMLVDGEIEFQGMTRGMYHTLVHLIKTGRLPSVPSMAGRPPSAMGGAKGGGSKRRRE